MKPDPKPRQKREARKLKEARLLLGRRIYACLSACGALEAAAHNVLLHRQARGHDDSKDMELLNRCRIKADRARQDADQAMHELGIGYYQIYAEPIVDALSNAQKRRKP